MKKKLTPIFLSVTLIFQVGVIPQVSAKRIDNNINSAGQIDLSSKIIRALKYVGGTALIPAGLYLIYNYLRPMPEVVEPEVPDAEPIDGIPLVDAVHPDQARTLDQKINDYEAILNRYSDRNYSLKLDEIDQICNDAIVVLNREPSLLRIGGPTIIVGDTHANIGSIQYSIRKFLREVHNGKSILFLGDYVDRGKYAPGGPNSIKNVALLLKLKTMFPDKVFLLRGNHEDASVNSRNGFGGPECAKEYGDDGENVFNRFNNAFNYLSLAAVVNDDTFCVHGGISHELNYINQINDIEKPLDYEQLSIKDFFDNMKDPGSYNSLAIDLLWSDPCESLKEFISSNGRGAGQMYGRNVTKAFLARNNLRRIVRAHEVVDGHADVFGDGSVITLFSAPDYHSLGGNIGEIAEINGDNIVYERIRY